jgi:hypothetical protein
LIGFELQNLDGLWWLLLLLGPFLLLQRRLHLEIQSALLLIFHRSDVSLALFSLIFFPGVLLHEGSHYLMARVLGVRTGRLSLLPRPLENGRLQLGYVETAKADVLRDALIGIAPLLSGGLFVAYAGIAHMGLPTIWENAFSGSSQTLSGAISMLFARSDFWLWFYLIVAVSSTMMPSRSDRRAWLPVILAVVFLLVLGLLAGAGPWLVQNIAVPLNAALRAVAMVIAISLVVHLVLVLPFFLLVKILERLTGFRVTASILL